MRRIKRDALIVVFLFGGLVIFKHMPAEKMKAAVEEGRSPTAVAAGKVLEIQTKTLTAAAKEALKAEVPPPAKVVEVIPHQAELAQYTSLHRKVFLNDQEAKQKDSLLKNASVLRSMGLRLMRSPVNAQAQAEQNVAIEMLLEAMRSGDSEVATQVLRGVVTDGQVEDVRLDMATRENLAGVKAEVLYQWSGLRPEQSGELATLLPGPVSQKIWQNVINAQASNVAESDDAH